MPKAKFKCKRCKRSFSMAAHLARHMSTIHATKKQKATAAKSARRPKRATTRPGVVRTVAASRRRIGKMPAFSTGLVATEGVVEAMTAHHRELIDQRAALDAQIDAFAKAMETIGEATPLRGTRRVGKNRGRPVKAVGRKGSLKDYIVRVMSQSSKPMSPQDIGTRVKKAGYKTKAQDLTKAVSNTLPDLKSVKRVGFGQYSLIA